MAVYRLALSARADIAHLFEYTEKNFGEIARLVPVTFCFTGLPAPI
jgi:plasmid stabilization system protein ParE